MIKNTYQLHSEGILSAYKDNAAVLTGTRGYLLAPNGDVYSGPVTSTAGWQPALPGNADACTL